MRIYGLKNCDTCRKAAKAIAGAELIDIRANPMEPDLLAKALETFGAALVNTRSTTWRGLSEEERANDPRDLLRAHSALMKRPLIDADGVLHLGWGKDTQGALIG
ncbi:MAG: ArsC/Spx/MgsR family protein [Aliishimia sp.]